MWVQLKTVAVNYFFSTQKVFICSDSISSCCHWESGQTLWYNRMSLGRGEPVACIGTKIYLYISDWTRNSMDTDLGENDITMISKLLWFPIPLLPQINSAINEHPALWDIGAAIDLGPFIISVDMEVPAHFWLYTLKILYLMHLIAEWYASFHPALYHLIIACLITTQCPTISDKYSQVL